MYDHVGLKSGISEVNNGRTKEKVSKGREAIDAAFGIDLKPGGLTIKACCMIYWSIVLPIFTFASELWILDGNDIHILY